MKQKIIFIICLLIPLGMEAQKLAVINLKHVPADLSASQFERLDFSDEPCGLVKIQLADEGVKFEGNVFGEVEYKNGEYWVYMTQRSYMLRIKHPKYVPLDVNFRDYSISGVQSKATYILTLKMLTTASQSDKGNLKVNYTPTQSEVWIDGKMQGNSPNIFQGLSTGQHEVRISKDEYKPKTLTITIEGGQTVELTGELEPTSAREIITVEGISFNMVHVDGGTFMMGSNDGNPDDEDYPAHQVTLSPYSIGETEVTQELWEAVMADNPSRFKGNKLPVESVSWDDCQEFISGLNEITGRSFRLPTEAEWEFAARGGIHSGNYEYSGSNTIGDVAWCSENSEHHTHEVKTKQANEIGLYDMTGNVSEWCQDQLGPYPKEPQTNPKGTPWDKSSPRIHRGGGYLCSEESNPITSRSHWVSTYANLTLGLRLAE